MKRLFKQIVGMYLDEANALVNKHGFYIRAYRTGGWFTQDERSDRINVEIGEDDTISKVYGIW